MPPTVAVAAFIFGAILVLIALLGGGFKLFGAEVPGTVGKSERTIAGVLGAVLMIVALVNSFARSGPASPPAASLPLATTSPMIAAGSQPTVSQAVTPAPSPATEPPTPTLTPAPPTPTPTPSPSPTQTPAPTLTPSPKAGDVLYQADWSSGANGWSSTYGWKALNGTLLNDASTNDRLLFGWKTIWIPAPYQTTDIDGYAVEAEIQLVKRPDYCWSFGLVARGTYQVGMHKCGFSELLKINGKDVGEVAGREFSLDTNKHTYRFEAKGNTLKLLIDGAVLLDATNNRYLSGKEVGIWSESAELIVHSFKVIKL